MIFSLKPQIWGYAYKLSNNYSTGVCMSLLSRERKICPKCGQPYSYIDEEEIGGRVYLYANHYYKDPGDRKREEKIYR